MGFEARRMKQSALRKDKNSIHAFDHTWQRLKTLSALGFKPSFICDIGASKGIWTQKCLNIFPKAEYLCVDPLKENTPPLKELSLKHRAVHCWMGCLGSKRGEVIMNVDGDGSSILGGHWGNPYGTQRKIKINTLDNLLETQNFPQPDLIKLDVQGYELEVLKGAIKALKSTQAVIAEVSFFPFQSDMPVVHEVVGKLSEYGFVVHDILSVSTRPLDGATAQTDLFFLAKSHFLRTSNKWDHDSIY